MKHWTRPLVCRDINCQRLFWQLNCTVTHQQYDPSPLVLWTWYDMCCRNIDLMRMKLTILMYPWLAEKSNAVRGVSEEFQERVQSWLSHEPAQCLRLWVVDCLFLLSCLTALSFLVYCHHPLSRITSFTVHTQTVCALSTGQQASSPLD